MSHITLGHPLKSTLEPVHIKTKGVQPYQKKLKLQRAQNSHAGRNDHTRPDGLLNQIGRTSLLDPSTVTGPKPSMSLDQEGKNKVFAGMKRKRDISMVNVRLKKPEGMADACRRIKKGRIEDPKLESQWAEIQQPQNQKAKDYEHKGVDLDVDFLRDCDKHPFKVKEKKESKEREKKDEELFIDIATRFSGTRINEIDGEEPSTPIQEIKDSKKKDEGSKLEDLYPSFLRIAHNCTFRYPGYNYLINISKNPSITRLEIDTFEYKKDRAAEEVDYSLYPEFPYITTLIMPHGLEMVIEELTMIAENFTNLRSFSAGIFIEDCDRDVFENFETLTDLNLTIHDAFHHVDEIIKIKNLENLKLSKTKLISNQDSIDNLDGSKLKEVDFSNCTMEDTEINRRFIAKLQALKSLKKFSPPKFIKAKGKEAIK